uniref:MICOS complex subunit MIC13 n=1 Tax=Angiostrongylus cantonensis TaxID=6313 RepID=A0A0K0DEC2_ANGCA
MGFLWSLSKFSIKVALVAGAVKLSIDSGVWSLDNENGANLYNKVKRYILPGTIVFPKKAPSVDEVQLNVAQCWNNSVDRVSANICPSSTSAGLIW